MVSDGRETDWTPTRWYRILKPDGSLWMETSDPKEVKAESEKTGWPVEHLFQLRKWNWRKVEL